ncbi:MAG: hypothetical protein H0U70_03465 [Tatlockia sp.]|nr:hypothetical protein [Tatlockia sp.]
MLKQSLIYLVLSILLVTFARYAQLLLSSIDKFYTYLNIKFTPIFNQIDLGPNLRQGLLLALIPLTITAVPALSYRLVRGKTMPYLIESTWCVWLAVVMSVILIRV